MNELGNCVEYAIFVKILSYRETATNILNIRLSSKPPFLLAISFPSYIHSYLNKLKWNTYRHNI